ncbi:anti-sigma regulatory factor (Ser/Thr protein kinase)/serine/threonine protein phosphatase PrpC [Actinoplanes octamycinicus]|uniref:Anti-sigma regulatory factor (Ser/Thr protein kinase)/serine/threonine protein phosphatase PrpC n=1 Tax=Actinoplanes octamycinicus TaxID=135948 RepID=A0A7W7GU81_9ACTN|nr:anti-sigma regulatory factor (Ser/Thr protein kinase)/serine/threonine protein phosphatase PrpC [Actinoplanes octamycinicus]GIE57502.1 transcriptional regulator [Actinoplanes octamycinicus]
MSVPEGLLDEGVWFRVEAAGTAAAVRRTAERLATDLAMPEQRIAELSIVAAEAAGNLVKHALQGTILVRAVRTPEQAGVELIAIDSGPGMVDVAHSMGDGHSTAGSLGIGLGAILRQASRWDLHSLPGRGTVLAVQVWPEAPPPPFWAAGLTRPITGETVSGDAVAAREAGGRRQLLVCDGLGHGGLAAAASREAVRVFRQTAAASPAAVVEALHRSLGHTRGAALAVAELDADAALVRYAGMGNIAGTVFHPDGSRRGMISMPGIAGHQRRQIREYEYPLSPGAVVVMHSDGLVDRWNPADYPGLLTRSPEVIAGTLLRDAGTRRDDAGVLVARLP